MKRIYITFIAISTLLLAQCGKEFLEKYPEHQISKENFYKIPADAEGGLMAVYDGLQNFEHSGYVKEVPDALTDDVKESSGDQPQIQLETFSFDATNLRTSNLWIYHYRTIARANELLKGIPEIDAGLFSGNRRLEIEAEARFLRAYTYFNLVRMYGGVPLVLSVPASAEPEDIFIEKSAVSEVYEAILDDLNYANEHLPITAESKGTATVFAAKALLARIHLTLENWDEAAAYAEEVISSGRYTLLNNFDDLWNPAIENTEEAIFELQFTAGDKEFNGLNSIILPWEVDSMTWKKYWLPSDNLVNFFQDNNDSIRLNSTIFFSEGPQAGPHRWKSRDRGTGWMTSPQNMIEIRLAEMYLIKAEALNEASYGNGEALNALNTVRRRVFADEYDASELNNQATFRNAVYTERRLELALEGFRWFDLLRTGRAIEVLDDYGVQISEYQLLLPIPQSEIDLNPALVQNPGWSAVYFNCIYWRDIIKMLNLDQTIIRYAT